MTQSDKSLIAQQGSRWPLAKILWVSLMIAMKLAAFALLAKDQAAQFIYAGF